MSTNESHALVGEVLPPQAVQLMQAAEIDMQIATALKYPRSVQSFHRRVKDLAMFNADIAAACSYRLKRSSSEGGDKQIIGPSARFAEVVASSYGNCRYAARVVGEDEFFVTAQGVFHDLESNALVSFEVRRSIKGKRGRYSTDMIAVTANAACSIALRNAVFKGVPKALWSDLWEETKKVAKGDEKTLQTRRQNMLYKFQEEHGVKPEEIYAYLDVKGVQDIDTDRLVELAHVMASIQDGDTTADAVFREKPAQQPEGDKPSTAASKMDDLAAGKKGGKKAAAAKQPAPDADPAGEPAAKLVETAERPPRDESAGPTVGSVTADILRATTGEQVDEALDLARGFTPVDREKLRQAADKRKESFKPAPVPETRKAAAAEKPAAQKPKGGLFEE